MQVAEAFNRETEENLELALDIYLSLPILDLRDLLRAELEDAPGSPIAMELRRRIREYCRERAESAADEITKGD